MLVTLLGVVMLVKEEQFKNVYPLMLVTLSGMAMLVKEEQPSNAP